MKVFLWDANECVTVHAIETEQQKINLTSSLYHILQLVDSGDDPLKEGMTAQQEFEAVIERVEILRDEWATEWFGINTGIREVV